MKNLFGWIRDPRLFLWFIWRKCSRLIKSDELYLKVYYRLRMREKLDLKNPITFNQKIQWLKIHNKDKKYRQLVDKYEVRKIIQEIIGNEYLIPLLGVWDRFDDIDFEKLPNEFVLKPNHISGSVVICRGKENFNFKKAKKILSKALKRNYYYAGRETPYKNVRARIIAEKYMVDESGEELKDYKFFCFNGVAKLLYIASERNKGRTKFNFYDINFNPLPFTNAHGRSDRQFVKPENFDKMISLAEKLSAGFAHVRVDLYNVSGEIYFGEYTFHHMGGIFPFKPKEWDKRLGDMIEL